MIGQFQTENDGRGKEKRTLFPPSHDAPFLVTFQNGYWWISKGKFVVHVHQDIVDTMHNVGGLCLACIHYMCLCTIQKELSGQSHNFKTSPKNFAIDKECRSTFLLRVNGGSLARPTTFKHKVRWDFVRQVTIILSYGRSWGFFLFSSFFSHT